MVTINVQLVFSPVNNNNFHHHQYSCHICTNLLSGFNTFFLTFVHCRSLHIFEVKKKYVKFGHFYSTFISFIKRLVWCVTEKIQFKTRIHTNTSSTIRMFKKWNGNSLDRECGLCALSTILSCVERICIQLNYPIGSRFFFLYPFLNVSLRPQMHTFARQWNIADIYCVRYVSVFMYVGSVRCRISFPYSVRNSFGVRVCPWFMW